jgi:hypothetical protein
MRVKYLLASAAGVVTLMAGAGLAAAQSDEDGTTETTTDTVAPEATTNTTDTSDTTDTSPDTVAPADAATVPEGRERPAGGDGCNDGATDGTAPDDSSS